MSSESIGSYCESVRSHRDCGSGSSITKSATWSPQSLHARKLAVSYAVGQVRKAQSHPPKTFFVHPDKVTPIGTRHRRGCWRTPMDIPQNLNQQCRGRMLIPALRGSSMIGNHLLAAILIAMAPLAAAHAALPRFPQ